MLRFLLSPASLRQAAAVARVGPYVDGAQVSRPWLAAAGFIALSAAFLLGLMLLIGVAGVIAQQMGVTLIEPDLLEPGRRITMPEEIRLVVLLAVILGLMALGLLGAAMVMYRRPSRDFLWPDQPGGWRLLGIGFVVLTAMAFIQWPAFALLEPGGVPPILNPNEPAQTRLLYAVVVAVGLFFAAAAEEIAFRGVLLRILGGLTRNVWFLVALNGVLFSLIHLDPDPVAFVARALSGMVWTWAALRLGGIAFGIGAHWANNLFIAWLLEPISAAAAPGQAIPAPYLAAELITTLAVLIAVELLARGRVAPR